MKSKWIRFEVMRRLAKTNVWGVYESKNDDLLGRVKWQNGWRQYVFHPESSLYIFSWDCLKEISDFVKKQNDVHRAKRGRTSVP